MNTVVQPLIIGVLVTVILPSPVEQLLVKVEQVLVALYFLPAGFAQYLNVETVGLMITSLVVINCLARGVSGPDTWYMGESQLGSFLKERILNHQISRLVLLPLYWIC